MGYKARTQAVSRYLNYVIAFSLLLIAQTSIASTSFNLRHLTWELLVVPGNTAGTSIRSLFADDLPANSYSTDWIVYTFDSDANRYRQLDIDGSIATGQGFWMIQSTGSNVDIDVPATLVNYPYDTQTRCVAGLRCASIPFNTNQNSSALSMLGVPSTLATSTDDLLIVNKVPGYPCSGGCDINQGSNKEQNRSQLWTYDSSTNSYLDANTSGRVEAWKGFWFTSLPAAFDSQASINAPGPTNACTWFVSPNGNNSNDGRSSTSPTRDPSAAIVKSKAGDTICLQRGTYSATIEVENKSGTRWQPITLQPMPGDEGRVLVQGKERSLSTGVRVTNSSYIEIIGMDIQQFLRGIQYNSVTGGRIVDNKVSRLEQEAIRVGALNGSQDLEGIPSSLVRVSFNTISDTGNRPGTSPGGLEYNEFGEGVYIGSGNYPDASHDIIVEFNNIADTTAEGIELKPYTYNVVVKRNLVSNNRLKYSGAISVSIGPRSDRNGNYLVTDNVVYNVKSRQYTIGGIVVGHGDTTVSNNRVWGIEGGRSIRVYTTFTQPNSNNVNIVNNIAWNPGTNKSIALHDGNGGFDLNVRADVTMTGNITDDGSAGSLQVTSSAFVGPLSGDADSGDGPGSGFNVN